MTRHEPDPSFLSHLERETRFALRRAREDASSAKRVRLMQRLRSAALVVLSLGLGAGVVVAAQQIEDSRWTEQRLARNKIKSELATQRLAGAREQLQRAEQLYAAGMFSSSEMREATRRVSGLAKDARLLTLEREELELGGRPPERLAEETLTAALVRGRDFVSERLRVERDALVERRDSRQADAAQVELLVEGGVESTAASVRARAEVEREERALAKLDRRLGLRADFVLGRIGAAECERSALTLDAEAEVLELTARVALARGVLEHADKLHTFGVAPDPIAERLALAEAEAELALAELALRVLR
jgi:hypothetical protein